MIILLIGAVLSVMPLFDDALMALVD